MNSKIVALIFSVFLLFACKQEVKKEGLLESSKSRVTKKSQEIFQEKEGSFYIKNWIGVYTFDYGGEHMGEEFDGTVKFQIKEASSKIYFNKEEELIEIVNITKDTIHFQNKKGDIYKIYKDKQGYFNVGGHEIYMLNPPNESYLLTKEK
ncbi:hypothetical protein [Aquimarina muelleri]|uniref:Lipoprotein n=1 Tax=Aquimarina muelleri TaxID=279356 RepID=A0A918N2D6_9FLAO|nr:hypothetical protein [Aquimarina muelleri]MCX2762318.1 hypothetical protein [Aquimarina muelleri]GGX17608.1 hypothetical protein GCM10007384_18750 [Aquimarina muelleri]